MKDESFELLTKMYSEFTEFKNDMTSFREETGSRLDKIETTLEHDIKNKLQALHERAAANTDKLDGHTQRLETVENKLDYLVLSVNSQDKRLEVVETFKKKKAK